MSNDATSHTSADVELARLDKKLDAATEKSMVQNARIRFLYLKRADELAKKHGYKELSGMDALCRYFADKYHWTPDQTRSLSTDDLIILLEGAE